MYAIISAGNKQYRVSQGETIYIDKVNQEDGSTISFDVLMVENNGEIKVGNPTVAGATVEGKVVAQVKGEKIMIYKYKSKKNYHRRQGHRQPYTKVEITAIPASPAFPLKDIPAMQRKAATSSAQAFRPSSSRLRTPCASW